MQKPTAQTCSLITRSAADSLISLKFGTDIDHATSDVLQMFEIKRSKVKVMAGA